MASIAVVFWFEWTDFGHSEIVGLFLVQFGEFYTQLFQMGRCYLFVQLENQIGEGRGERGRGKTREREEVEKEIEKSEGREREREGGRRAR